MNAYMLEQLFEKLNRPKWFWPLIYAVLTLLLLLGGNDE